MKRVAVYIITGGDGLGGAWHLLIQYLTTVDRNKFDVTVYYHCTSKVSDDKRRKAIESLGIPIINVDVEGVVVHAQTSSVDNSVAVPESTNASGENSIKGAVRKLCPKGLQQAYYYSKRIRELTKHFVQKKYDVIHFILGAYPGYDIPIIASKRAGIKVRYLDLLIDPAQQRTESWYMKLLGRARDQAATHVRVMSHKMKEFVIQKSYFPKNSVHVIYPGISLKEYVLEESAQSLRQKLGISDSKRVVTSVCRFAPIKGHQYLLEAIRSNPEIRKNVTYLLAGSGSLKEQIKNEIEQSNLKDCVKFLGFVDSVPEVLNASDIFINHSLREGGPLTILEAMASGLPVISTDVGFAGEVIEDDESGFVVSRENSKAIDEGLRKLLSLDDRALKEMGARGKEKAFRDFSDEERVREVLNVYSAEEEVVS